MRGNTVKLQNRPSVGPLRGYLLIRLPLLLTLDSLNVTIWANPASSGGFGEMLSEEMSCCGTQDTRH